MNYSFNNLIKQIFADKKFVKTIMAENQPYCELVLEGLLQHYGIKTHYVDIVDNHWIALWFGLYESTKLKNIHSYLCYTRRTVDKCECTDDMYQYLILIASNNNIINLYRLNPKSKTVTIDLRANLPTMFLRPHAQHGFVMRKLKSDEDGYDISKYIVGIIEIPIKCVGEWLRNGTLLTVIKALQNVSRIRFYGVSMLTDVLKGNDNKKYLKINWTRFRNLLR